MDKLMMEAIKKYNLLDKGNLVLIAFSGGGDSTALLSALWESRLLLGIDIAAAHVNHGIRGLEAERDEEFTRRFCHDRGIPYKACHVNAPEYARQRKISLENAARVLRHSELNKAMAEFGAHYISTAHNLNDQAETVLMRLMRGSSGYGLRGMDIKSGNIIRPLLEISRGEIESYLIRHKLPYVTDSTNISMDYTRNKIRNYLIPIIEKEFNPGIVHTLSKTAKSLNDDNAVLESLTKQACLKYVTENENYITISSLVTGEDKSLLPRLIRMCVKKLTGDTTDFESTHTEMVMDLFNKDSGKGCDLTKGLKGANYFGDVAIYRDTLADFNEKPLNQGEFVYIDENYGYISVSLGKPLSNENYINTCTGVFNCDKIEKRLSVRRRAKGDIFVRPDGRELKLKDYMIDRKLPWFLRDSVPVVSLNGKVIWVLSENSAQNTPRAADGKIFIQLWRLYSG